MNNKISIKYIYNLLLKNKKELIFGQIITIIAIFISVPIPLLLPMLVDEILLDKPNFLVPLVDKTFGVQDAFKYIVIVTVVVIFLRFMHYIFNIVITKIFTKISKIVIFDIRKKLLLHLKKVTINEYETLGSGRISSNLITDINTLDAFIVSVSSKFLTSCLTLIAVAFVVIQIDLILGLMIVLIQPTIVLISKSFAKKSAKLKKDENLSIENFQNSLNETLNLFVQIKASNKEKKFFNEAVLMAENIKIASNNYNFKSVSFEKLSYTISLIAFEILRATGLLLVAYSDLSIGLMLAMFGYIWFIMTPIQDILSIQYSLANAKTAISRLNKILDLKCEENGEIILDKKTKKVDILVKNLSFSYSNNKNVLKDISFEIKAGEKVAIIGASGSGKTTLSQIIAGFYTKSSGDIFYNNISIDKLDKSSLRDNIFLVLQMPILFNNTLRFNLTMGEDIPNEEILKALKIAQLEDMFANLSDGLDTIVGKHGVRLSGGQRQRLSIARMVLAKPNIVIFDESTSALDVKTEQKIFESLNQFLKDKTVITVAHRLSTVKNSSKVFVIEDGFLVQNGTHEELESKKGYYSNFLQNQLV